MAVRLAAAGGAAAALACPASAAAGHSFTELYNPFYALGVALVVGVSFLLIALFVGRTVRGGGPRRDLLTLPWLARAPWPAVVAAVARVAAALGLLFVVVAGLFGSRLETWNIAPTAVWLLAWVLIPAVQVLAGDVWSVINPWRALFDWMAPAARPRRRYPERLGVWPAALLFFGLVWFKAVAPEARDPRTLALLIVGYSALTLGGMRVFGRDVWLARGECFSVFYGLLAAMSPLERRATDVAVCAECAAGCRTAAGPACIDCAACYARARARQLTVRPWALGLLARGTAPLDVAGFVLLMLGGGMFGGLLDTRWWERLRAGLGLAAERSGGVDSLALGAFMVLTMAVYALAAELARRAAGPVPDGRPGGRRCSLREMAQAFAYSLVPLAAGFHLTHGLDHSLESLQMMVRLVSDPFGFGWNLFGTRARPFDKWSPWVVWYTQLALIVAAHVAGLWVAHARALTVFGSRARAFRSQMPLVGVMVLFTISGLWILSKIPMVM